MKRFCVVLGIVWAATPTLQAATTPEVLLSNLSQPGAQSASSLNQRQWLAAPFITGHEPAELNSVSLVFGPRLFSPEGTVQVTLREDSGGLPGTPMLDGLLSGPSVPDAYSVVTYSAITTVGLESNTRYWIVATSDEPASGGIGYTLRTSTSHDYDSDHGWTLPHYFAFSPDQGASWRSTETAVIPQPLMFEVTGTIIPEPTTLTLFGLACVMWTMTRGREPTGRQQAGPE